MNERIKNLREEAMVLRRGHGAFGESESYWELDEQKFAELIVQECISVLNENNPCPPGTTIMYSSPYDEYLDKGWQIAVETKTHQIKRHFGVEE